MSKVMSFRGKDAEFLMPALREVEMQRRQRQAAKKSKRSQKVPEITTKRSVKDVMRDVVADGGVVEVSIEQAIGGVFLKCLTTCYFSIRGRRKDCSLESAIDLLQFLKSLEG